VKALRTKGAALRTTDGMAFDTSTAMGKCFLDMLGVFAEFETSLRRERQMEGIRKAKAAGVYKGRPHTIDADAIQALKAEGLGVAEIARCLKISRASVYRLSPVQPVAPQATQGAIIRWQVPLGAQIVASGYPTMAAAQRAARSLAEEHGSLPYEVRPIAVTDIAHEDT
jgi:hypothetical protein